MQVTISLTSPLMREDPAPEKEEKAGDKAAEKGQRSQAFSPINALCLPKLKLRNGTFNQAHRLSPKCGRYRRITLVSPLPALEGMK